MAGTCCCTCCAPGINYPDTCFLDVLMQGSTWSAPSGSEQGSGYIQNLDPPIQCPNGIVINQVFYGTTFYSYICAGELVPGPPNLFCGAPASTPPYCDFPTNTKVLGQYVPVGCPTQATLWTIPLKRIAPPKGSGFVVAYVNALSDYYGGSWSPSGILSTGLNYDAQGYCTMANPSAGCKATITSRPLEISTSGCTEVTIANTLGVAVFIGIDDQCRATGYMQLLDLQTQHVATCLRIDTVTLNGGFNRGAYSAGPLTTIANLGGLQTESLFFDQCSNPVSGSFAALGFPNSAVSITQTATMTSPCGTLNCARYETSICGTVDPFTPPTTLTSIYCYPDGFTYSMDQLYWYLYGGDNKAPPSFALLGNPNVRLQNTYTLSISGDLPYWNGTYTLAKINKDKGAIATWGGWSRPFPCTLDLPDGNYTPYFNAFWKVSLYYLHGVTPPYWASMSVEVINPTSLDSPLYFGSTAQSVNISPLVASGNFTLSIPSPAPVPVTTIPGWQQTTDGGTAYATSPATFYPCSGVSSGTVHWTIS